MRAAWQNRAPKTWLCECSQFNLWGERRCVACDRMKRDCWDKRDQENAVWIRTGEDTYRFYGVRDKFGNGTSLDR